LAVVVLATLPVLVLYIFFAAVFPSKASRPVASRADRSRRRRRCRRSGPEIAARGAVNRGAVRAAAGMRIHSWRLLPPNVVWAASAIALTGRRAAPPAALLLVPLLAFDAGIFRVTTRIARGQAVSFWACGRRVANRLGRDPAFGGMLVAGRPCSASTCVRTGL